jgi:peroxiredoxin/predicted 2-oxoglutarate/Fe(II)-dependent dioxygenase YbiX
MVDVAPLNAPPSVSPPLYAGDPAPWFRAPSDANPDFQFNTLGGRRLILAFLPSLSKGDGQTIAEDFLASAPRFASHTTGLIIVSTDPADQDRKIPDDVHGVRYIFDPDRQISRLYGLASDDGAFRPASFILDERLRIAAVIDVRDAATHAESVLALYDRFGPAPNARRGQMQAPVLMIPGVFEPDFCRRLVDGYAAHGGQESGFMVERAGRTVLSHNHGHKSRADWTIEDTSLIAATRARIKRRVTPEIYRAFQFKVSRIERFLVACYSADKEGHFAPHRDNTTRGTAHRRFAVSINLNDDYDGGALVFPEFGRVHFRPPIGGACVFSCSLLHEATKVTRGQRFVFVPFLFDEPAEDVRLANAKYLD